MLSQFDIKCELLISGISKKNKEDILERLKNGEIDILIGTHAMLVFLALNGIELKYTQKELYETILNVASGSVDYNGLLQWVLNHQN